MCCGAYRALYPAYVFMLCVVMCLCLCLFGANTCSPQMRSGSGRPSTLQQSFCLHIIVYNSRNLVAKCRFPSVRTASSCGTLQSAHSAVSAWVASGSCSVRDSSQEAWALSFTQTWTQMIPWLADESLSEWWWQYRWLCCFRTTYVDLCPVCELLGWVCVWQLV